jgi:hypothetical protein
MKTRFLFAVSCLAAVVAIAAYIAITNKRPMQAGPAPGSGATNATKIPIEFVRELPEGPMLLFRESQDSATYGRLAALRLPLDPSLSTPRMIGPLSCERIHYAAGSGVCLMGDVTTLPVHYRAILFDRTFQQKPPFDLTGPPIRARVSPDGRRAAMTVFETGHSYADDSFSTRTTIVDVATGQQILDLEQLTVTKNGARFSSPDFNFWGMTFARDGNRFYATLKTQGELYLIEGSIDAKTATVVRPGVECPSLSPDERRIVFKKPLGSEVGWHLNVLDLATGTERPLNQTQRSVDDQVDWFDNSHIVYHDSTSEGTGIWILGVDDNEPSRLLLPGAYSPAVQR